MSLTDDQAMLLRQVAKGSPMGRLLRRYWHPVATSSDLTLEKPTKRVRILAESLVLFKDRAGRSALIPERCPHDGASMLAGRVTDHGIRCLLHGWFFDSERMCSVWEDDSVQATGYPVREHAGLYWGYLGAEPPPELPSYEALSSPGASQRIVVYPPIRGHWLLEGRFGLDPWRHLQRLGDGESRQATAEICASEYVRSPEGIVRTLTYSDGSVEHQPYVFPTLLHAGPLWLLTPMGEEQTQVISVEIIPRREDASDEGPEIVNLPPGDRNPEWDTDGRYSFFAPWGSILAGEASLGSVLADGLAERVGDSGLEMLYAYLLEQLAAVEAPTP